MASDNWSDIKEVPNFLASSDWEEKLEICPSLSLELHIAEGTKKGIILLKVVNAVKATKVKKGS